MLDKAAKLEHERIVSMFLEMDSQKRMISKDMIGGSTLHRACSASSTKRLSLAKLLIDGGFDVHAKTDDGITPLIFAASACAFVFISLRGKGEAAGKQDSVCKRCMENVGEFQTFYSSLDVVAVVCVLLI